MPDGSDPNDPAYPRMYEHNGTAATYRSYMAYVPDRQFGLVLTMNSFDETVPSRWGYLESSVMRLALGHEPRERLPSDGVIRQFARPLYGLVLVLQLAVSLWSLRAQAPTVPAAVAAVVHAGGLAFTLGYAPIAAASPLPVVLRGAPDLGLMTILSVALALTWLGLCIVRARRARRSDQ
jgi:hypothetical protein